MTFGPLVHLISGMGTHFMDRSIENKTTIQEELRRSSERLITSPDELRPFAKRVYNDVREFVHEEILPKEHELGAQEFDDKLRWTQPAIMEELKSKAKASGLWNLFIPFNIDEEMRYGKGLTNLEYAFMAEEMGRTLFGSEPFNCSPPDTGNMEVLIKYGEEEHKEKDMEDKVGEEDQGKAIEEKGGEEQHKEKAMKDEEGEEAMEIE